MRTQTIIFVFSFSNTLGLSVDSVVSCAGVDVVAVVDAVAGVDVVAVVDAVAGVDVVAVVAAAGVFVVVGVALIIL
jgi:hypothetical protein